MSPETRSIPETTPTLIAIGGGFSAEQKNGAAIFARLANRLFNHNQARTRRQVENILGEPASADNIHILDMPNRYSADYEDWKAYFDEHIKHIETELTLVGYSLGATFLLKYLSENTHLKDRIRKVYLISGVYTKGQDRTFSVDEKANGLSEYPIEIIHGSKDTVVPYNNLKKIHSEYPGLRYTTLDSGHKVGPVPHILREINGRWEFPPED